MDSPDAAIAAMTAACTPGWSGTPLANEGKPADAAAAAAAWAAAMVAATLPGIDASADDVDVKGAESFFRYIYIKGVCVCVCVVCVVSCMEKE